MITCEYVPAPKDLTTVVAFVSNELEPLYRKSWDETWRGVYDEPFDFDVATFGRMWASRMLKIVMARENGVAVGFVLGAVARPLTYAKTSFEVHDWYDSGREDVRRQLFSFLSAALQFMDVDEVTVRAKEIDISLGEGWGPAGIGLSSRFVRG